MCLAIPGKIVKVADQSADPNASPLARAGKVDFGGVTKDVNLAYVPDAVVGDYVIVHVGFAISKLDEAEAMQVFDYLRQMQEAEASAPTRP